MVTQLSTSLPLDDYKKCPWAPVSLSLSLNASEKADWPKISVVTPSYNQGKYIEETIVSILSQEGNFFLDYVIMDGGSTDNSTDIIRKYDDLMKNDQWSIKCRGISYRWISEQDDGQSDAINKGFHLATGSIFGWLNSDDIYYPGALEKIAMISWDETDFCYGKGMWISRNGKDLFTYPTIKPTKSSLYVQCTLCQPTVFFKRATFESLGDFSLEYHCVFDYEYWMRGIFRGKRFVFVPEFTAKSRMYPDNKSLSGQDTVTSEVLELLKKYYANENMNGPLKRYFCRRVNKKTNKHLKVMFRKLSDE